MVLLVFWVPPLWDVYSLGVFFEWQLWTPQGGLWAAAVCEWQRQWWVCLVRMKYSSLREWNECPGAQVLTNFRMSFFLFGFCLEIWVLFSISSDSLFFLLLATSEKGSLMFSNLLLLLYLFSRHHWWIWCLLFTDNYFVVYPCITHLAANPLLF